MKDIPLENSNQKHICRLFESRYVVHLLTVSAQVQDAPRLLPLEMSSSQSNPQYMPFRSRKVSPSVEHREGHSTADSVSLQKDLVEDTTYRSEISVRHPLFVMNWLTA